MREADGDVIKHGSGSFRARVADAPDRPPKVMAPRKRTMAASSGKRPWRLVRRHMTF
jgi:hypothetical protein